MARHTPLIAIDPSCVALKLDNEPWNCPSGVRATEAIYTGGKEGGAIVDAVRLACSIMYDFEGRLCVVWQERKARGRRDMLLFFKLALAVSGRCQTAEIFPKVWGFWLRFGRRGGRRFNMESNRSCLIMGTDRDLSPKLNQLS